MRPMADDSPPAVPPRSHDIFTHPRISGGDGSSLDRAVKIDSTGMEMALMLMQLYLEQALGVKLRAWLPGTERWVDSANHAPRSIRVVGVELGDGTQREFYFDLGSAARFGRESRGGAASLLPPVPEPAPVLVPPPVPRALPLGLVTVTGPPPVSATVPAGEPAEMERSETGTGMASMAVSRELSEILNREEPWPSAGAGSSARQPGMDWGWWLTLAASATAGALAVAWW